MPKRNPRPPAHIDRMRHGTRTWHFCSNCGDWPESGFDEAHKQPTTGLFCAECLSNESQGTCAFAGLGDASA